MRKRLTNIRANTDTRDRLKELSRELSFIERRDVRTPEVLRRTLNIPNLPHILKNDAELKRRWKKI